MNCLVRYDQAERLRSFSANPFDRLPIEVIGHVAVELALQAIVVHDAIM